MSKGQDTREETGALCNQVVGTVPECPLDDALPSREMEERAVRLAEDKRVPQPLVAGPKGSYADCRLRSVQDAITGNGPVPALRNSLSMRIQAKSRSRRRNRGSVRSRLR